MAIIIFILILSLLVLIHEFGHFIVAKKNGIRVEEFGLGLPPRIFGKRFGETLYSLNWLPLGGFVKLTGEEAVEGSADTLDPKNFSHKTPWQRLAVLLAGVTMNSILAIILFYIYFAFHSFRTQPLPAFFDFKFAFGDQHYVNTIIGDIPADIDSPAAKASLKPGDVILAVNNKAVADVSEIRTALKGLAGKEVTLSIIGIADLNKENVNPKTVTIVPSTDASGNTVLGVYLVSAVILDYSQGTNKLLAGPMHSYNVLTYSFSMLGNLIKQSFVTKDFEPVSQSVAGPVGMYKIVGSIVSFGGMASFWALLDFVAIMSLSLALLNIMPFPALDGGRAVFVLIEAFSGKKVPQHLEDRIHRFGMAALLTFILLVTIKDIFA